MSDSLNNINEELVNSIQRSKNRLQRIREQMSTDAESQLLLHMIEQVLSNENYGF